MARFLLIRSMRLDVLEIPMHEIIQKALRKGVDMHEAGELILASQLYETVISLQPDNPDANHNLGVLAVSVGNIQEAVPFLKRALDANPSKIQFWLSYIDVLIKLNRIADAKATLDTAKRNGTTSIDLKEIEQRIQKAIQTSSKANQISTEPQIQQPNILDSLKLDQALKLAKKKANEGFPREAKRIYRDILSKFPKNTKARDGFKGLASSSNVSASQVQDPPQDVVQSLIDIYSKGQLQKARQETINLLQKFPKSAILLNIQGAVLMGLGQLDLSVDAFKKALAIKPNFTDAYNNVGNAFKAMGKLEEALEAYNQALTVNPNYADAYNNMGVCLQDQGKLEEALEAYNKALAIKSDFAEAYSNMGVAYKKQGKLTEAIEAYNKAIAIKPDDADSYNNMGNAFKEQGRLEEAIETYRKVLAINPKHVDAVENLQILTVQLLPIIANYIDDFDTSFTQVNSEILLRPKCQIQNLIKTYLERDFAKVHTHYNNFKACEQKLLGTLEPEDEVFCNAYNIFIGKLLEANWDEELVAENTIYHLGESHCLSYAHRNIKVNGTTFKIAPRITFGAKAFHFYAREQNAYKSITKAHLSSLPKNSKVFLSYGEIDCRPYEGFLAAARKLDKPLDGLIDQTTEGYVKWFADQNISQQHQLHFMNVPSPVYKEKDSHEVNLEVLKTVAMFNAALKKYTLKHGFDMVDVFKFTADENGFSNRFFHVDNVHLGAKALPEIARQLT